jgi:hypothetical protein
LATDSRWLASLTKPSHANFDIVFKPDKPAIPTAMSISPDDGDAMLKVVKSPGSDDNKIVWQSNQQFCVKFVQVDDPSQPLKAGKELGDEKKEWNESKKKGEVWEYTLNLKQGGGHGPETVVAKYTVKHFDSKLEFDPVIIVGR